MTTEHQGEPEPLTDARLAEIEEHWMKARDALMLGYNVGFYGGATIGAVPALLAEVRRLRAEVEAARGYESLWREKHGEDVEETESPDGDWGFVSHALFNEEMSGAVIVERTVFDPPIVLRAGETITFIDEMGMEN